ncbi:MAG TPA: hypothetical protein VGL69_01980 [Solirubrobacteraceae bacterium]
MGFRHLSARGIAPARVVALAALGMATVGCGASQHSGHRLTTSGSALPGTLLREARPIGRGPEFHPPVRGQPVGACRPRLGPRVGVHVELFAADRVVLIAPGIGARPPLRRVEGRVVSARCFGAVVTRDPTGIVLVRASARSTIGDLMRSWGQPLAADRLLSFHGTVSAYVDGRRWNATSPSLIPLTRHAEIVLEIGPHVPPHRAFTFPAGT